MRHGEDLDKCKCSDRYPLMLPEECEKSAIEKRKKFKGGKNVTIISGCFDKEKGSCRQVINRSLPGICTRGCHYHFYGNPNRSCSPRGNLEYIVYGIEGQF